MHSADQNMAAHNRPLDFGLKMVPCKTAKRGLKQNF